MSFNDPDLFCFTHIIKQYFKLPSRDCIFKKIVATINIHTNLETILTASCLKGHPVPDKNKKEIAFPV